ncbi:hypothetical protein [Nguyenibacter vanlangensis]
MEVRIIDPFSYRALTSWKNRLAPTAGDRQVSDFIHDQQRGTGLETDLFREAAFALGASKRLDQFGEGAAIDAASRLDRRDTDGCGEVALACPGRPKEMDDFRAADELELGDRHDPVSLERGLKGKIEAFERLDRQETRGPQGDADPTSFPQAQFLGQQFVDRLDRADVAALQTAEGLVERFQSPRHMQVD